MHVEGQEGVPIVGLCTLVIFFIGDEGELYQRMVSMHSLAHITTQKLYRQILGQISECTGQFLRLHVFEFRDTGVLVDITSRLGQLEVPLYPASYQLSSFSQKSISSKFSKPSVISLFCVIHLAATERCQA